MKINITCLLLILFLSLSCTYTKNEVSFQPQKALDYCSFQTRRTLDELRKGGEIDYSMIPRNILKDQNSWNLRKISKEEWTAGFWPGVLWYEYQYSGNPEIRTQAEMFTNSLRDLASLPAYDHDLGFLIFCSYGNGYRLTGNPEYKDVIIEASNTLASLYNPVVETILSWPREREPNN